MKEKWKLWRNLDPYGQRYAWYREDNMRPDPYASGVYTIQSIYSIDKDAFWKGAWGTCIN